MIFNNLLDYILLLPNYLLDSYQILFISYILKFNFS